LPALARGLRQALEEGQYRRRFLALPMYHRDAGVQWLAKQLVIGHAFGMDLLYRPRFFKRDLPIDINHCWP